MSLSGFVLALGEYVGILVCGTATDGVGFGVLKLTSLSLSSLGLTFGEYAGVLACGTATDDAGLLGVVSGTLIGTVFALGELAGGFVGVGVGVFATGVGAGLLGGGSGALTGFAFALGDTVGVLGCVVTGLLDVTSVSLIGFALALDVDGLGVGSLGVDGLLELTSVALTGFELALGEDLGL